ncbi:MAG: four helix bundle protein [Candidatus Levybacteria bacterium]|nr:four helix bundle protein [Candidatus Levybacteria bacterium]
MATKQSHEFRKKLIEFAIKIIKLTKTLPKTSENMIIFNQIIRSSTSIGGNYAEAIFALTRADFIHCLNICKKETSETLHWLEVLLRLNTSFSREIQSLVEETESYLKIFISSVKTSQSKIINNKL